jgi:hypothetical protein
LQISKNRTAGAILSIFLLLTITFSLAALPVANAHDPPWTVPTWSYVAVTNDVIGVNQPFTIVYWPNAYPPTAQGAYGDRWTWTIEITKPDDSKETLGPYTSDPVGGGWVSYTPTQTGTYTIVSIMAEHKITGSPNGFPPGWGPYSFGYASVNDTYTGGTSDPVTVTVQEEPIPAWPEAPLPTQYWTRPINDANRNWYVLAGNWLAGAAQQYPIGAAGGTTSPFGYGKAPESAHIMWATPFWAGGIMDERFGDTGYQTAHYEGLGFTPPIILDGKIFYNVQSLPREGWYCLDLYTGETLYFHNTTGPVTGTGGGFDYSGSIAGEALSFGQIYNYESPNQHGGFPYLWSAPAQVMFGPTVSLGPWMMFDAYSGNYICSIGNATQTELRPDATQMGGFWVQTTGATGTAVYGKDGSILYYNIANLGNTTNPKRYLQVWNTSRAIWYEPVWSSNEYWMWRPTLNYTFDGRNGFSLNVSIPDVQQGGAYFLGFLMGGALTVREGEYAIGGPAGSNNEQGITQGHLWALSLKPGQEGTLLWNITFTPPSSAGNLTIQGPTVDPEDGVFLFSCSQTRQRWGYSLETGQLLWGPTPSEPQMNYYGMGANIYNGMLLSSGMDGVLIAYDIKTGQQLWNYTAAQVGYESPYGNYPIGITFIADGKIYLTSSEHSPTQPLWRGSYLRCVNASNGVELWKCLFWGAGMGAGSGAVIADGFIVGLNLYDNQIYCFGKGPSATTVTVQDDVISQGGSVLIKGTVTDQSPGATKLAKNLGYANGIPAISDEDQQAWMEYLYSQQVMPSNPKGVDVTLDAIDPNGNFIPIGTVTSDMSGMFKKAFVPEVPGEYTIIATFAGSNSYYSSYAETAINVEEAPASPTPATETTVQESPMLTYVLASVIALIVIVVAIGVLMLRRK